MSKINRLNQENISLKSEVEVLKKNDKSKLVEKLQSQITVTESTLVNGFIILVVTLILANILYGVTNIISNFIDNMMCKDYNNFRLC